jgi:hypothetical protein
MKFVPWAMTAVSYIFSFLPLVDQRLVVVVANSFSLANLSSLITCDFVSSGIMFTHISSVIELIFLSPGWCHLTIVNKLLSPYDLVFLYRRFADDDRHWWIWTAIIFRLTRDPFILHWIFVTLSAVLSPLNSDFSISLAFVRSIPLPSTRR